MVEENAFTLTPAQNTTAAMDLYAAPQRLVSLKGKRKFNILEMGVGEPTVILAAGYMGLTIDWALVQPYVARFARVVSFDNAGLGFSDPGPVPRTSSAIVSDLHQALSAADIPPPYVLVGHSAGGLRMRLFAAEHPTEVVGMVLIDSVLGDWQKRLFGGPSPSSLRELALCKRLLKISLDGTLSPDTPEYIERVRLPRSDLSPAMNEAFHRMWTRPSYLKAIISEGQNLRATTQKEVDADNASLGDLPVVVLRATVTSADSFIHTDGQAQLWAEMQEEIAARSSRSTIRMVDCGHNIPIEKPREVVNAIEEVVSMARSEGS